MSERELQRALLHVYANVERLGTYTPELFARFALSSADLQVLCEVMTLQRDELLLQAALLRDKQRRLIAGALPASAALATPQLTALLESFAVRDGVGDLAGTLRDFAEHASAACANAPTRELELIRFEALHASIALEPPAARRVSVVVRSAHDVHAAASARCWPAAVTPCWYFLFRGHGDRVTVLQVSPRLADLLELLQQGRSRDEILRTLETERERAAAIAILDRLVCAGAPIA